MKTKWPPHSMYHTFSTYISIWMHTSHYKGLLWLLSVGNGSWIPTCAKDTAKVVWNRHVANPQGVLILVEEFCYGKSILVVDTTAFPAWANCTYLFAWSLIQNSAERQLCTGTTFWLYPLDLCTSFFNMWEYAVCTMHNIWSTVVARVCFWRYGASEFPHPLCVVIDQDDYLRR